MKKIELKVGIHCQKCKTQVLKAATAVTGVDQVSVDVEKGILTIIGDVDPVLVTTKVRKTGKVVEIISVGPPKPPEKPIPKPPDNINPLPLHCNECQLLAVSFVPYNNGPICSIL